MSEGVKLAGHHTICRHHVTSHEALLPERCGGYACRDVLWCSVHLQRSGSLDLDFFSLAVVAPREDCAHAVSLLAVACSAVFALPLRFRSLRPCGMAMQSCNARIHLCKPRVCLVKNGSVVADWTPLGGGNDKVLHAPCDRVRAMQGCLKGHA